MDKEVKSSEKKRNLKLVEKYDNDDYSRYAAPDYIETNFEIGNETHDEHDNVIGHHMWSSGMSDEENFHDYGEYYGYGPKGYKRKDERIYEDVCELLMRHRGIDATEILVQVEDGVVKLSGKVQTKRMKHLAGLLLEDLPGVEEIKNDLNIIEGQPDPKGPAGVTKKDLGLI